MLKGLLEAKSNKVIAFECGLSVSSVKQYMRLLFRAIRVNTRMEAANWGRANERLTRLASEPVTQNLVTEALERWNYSPGVVRHPPTNSCIACTLGTGDHAEWCIADEED